MKLATVLILVLAAANVSRADGDPIAWPKKSESPRVTVDGDGNIAIAGDAAATTTLLLTLDAPKVPSHLYRLVGKIKYEDVAGQGHLVMWNHFGKDAYFTKTLAPEGKLGVIAGTSDWRDVELPFYSKPGMLPSKLVISLVLPGKGKVWITPLRLEEAAPLAASSEGFEFPWSLLAAGMSGLVGILGTLVALTPGSPGMRRGAFGLTALLIPCSLAALMSGVFLWAREAERDWIMPLALVVGLWIAVFIAATVLLRRTRAQEELRRMHALDASGR